MTNPILNNRIATNQVILWQYDKAVNLIRLINKWNELATVECEEFWNYFGNYVFEIDRADTYGLNVWGNLLGIPRPTITIPLGADSEEGGVDYVTIPSDDSSSEDSEDSSDDRFDEYGYDEDGYCVSKVNDDTEMKIVTIKNTLFRGLLKGRFFLMCHPPTVPNYNKYLSIVFGAIDHETGQQRRYRIFDTEGELRDYEDSDSSSEDSDISMPRFSSRNIAVDNQDMTMTFTFPQDATTEEAYLIFQHHDIVYQYPAGIRYPGEFIWDDLVIGLNQTQAVGQNYKNFVDGLVMVEDPDPVNPNGGIFSTTDRANYKVPAKTVGQALLIAVGEDITGNLTLSFSRRVSGNEKLAVWIDWGNGDAGYYYLPPASGGEDKLRGLTEGWDYIKYYNLNFEV